MRGVLFSSFLFFAKLFSLFPFQFFLISYLARCSLSFGYLDFFRFAFVFFKKALKLGTLCVGAGLVKRWVSLQGGRAVNTKGATLNVSIVLGREDQSVCPDIHSSNNFLPGSRETRIAPHLDVIGLQPRQEKGVEVSTSQLIPVISLISIQLCKVGPVQIPSASTSL